MEPRDPLEVIPAPLGKAIDDLPWWFIIGGNAVRCFCPFRPTRDVDFGVGSAENLDDLVRRLGERGKVEIGVRGPDTIHLRFDGITVSVFVLDNLTPFVEHRRLTPTGILATKLHAILGRGVRRDFFDLYVTMQSHSMGIADCLAAMRTVFQQDVNEPLLLRAMTWFEDADRELPLAGEGPRDWTAVKDFFRAKVGQLLVPPARELEIQKRVVDVHEAGQGGPQEFSTGS